MPQSWQIIDATCHSCHWWQEWAESMITAMTEILFFLTAVLLSAALVAVLHQINRDGAGRRVPPRSHPYDAFDPDSPHRFA